MPAGPRRTETIPGEAGAAGENAEIHCDIPARFQCRGGLEGFNDRFPNTPPQKHCFLGHGREQDAKDIISLSSQTYDLWQTIDCTIEGQKVFIKHSETKCNHDIIRELQICSKMVQHRDHIRSKAGCNAAAWSSPFDHLSLPLAACPHDQGGFLIASPLLIDTEGNQAEDLMSALMSEIELPGITAARRDERALRDFVKPLFTAVHQMHILNIAHRDMKPENVLLLRSQMKLVLIDFGHSKDVHLPGVQRTASGAKGTTGWVPWNVCNTYNRSAEHDPLKIDVFSLAQLLIVILFKLAPCKEKKMSSNATAGEIQVALTNALVKSGRDKGGVPKDDDRPGFPPLSQNLRDLLTGMLVQGNDNQRLSMRGALKHDWFTSEDPTLWNPPPAEPEELGRRNAPDAREPYETALIEEWHVMTAHSPVELIVEYPCKHEKFESTYKVAEPYHLDEPLFSGFIDSGSIQQETFERACEYGMDYFLVKSAKPYIEVNGEVLNGLQVRFPDAVPLCDGAAPTVALKDEMTEFVRSRVREGIFKPVMYKKPGAFARKVDSKSEKVQQTVTPPEDDNPYCFSFEAPWMNNTAGCPAILDVALGDFLGFVFDDEDPSRDEVWKLPRSYFVGPAKSFTRDAGGTAPPRPPKRKCRPPPCPPPPCEPSCVRRCVIS